MSITMTLFFKGGHFAIMQRDNSQFCTNNMFQEWCFINIFSVLHTVLQGIISTLWMRKVRLSKVK